MRPFAAALASLAGVLAFLAAPSPARAHCDTMDGPVVEEARAALASGDRTMAGPTLPARGLWLEWIRYAGDPPTAAEEAPETGPPGA